MKLSYTRNSILFFSFYFLINSSLLADTPTDEELLELEKQIEQKEIEQEKAKQRAAEETKRKAEEQRLMEERTRFEEERRKLEEERKKTEEAEKIKREEELARQAEQEKKEKYNSLINEAENALSNKDKNLAIKLFNEALTLYPENNDIKNRIREADKLKHKLCYDVLGWWINTYVYTIEFNLMDNGISESNLAHNPTWSCSNPENGEITIDGIGVGPPYNTFELSSDGNCLCRKLASEEEKNSCSIKGSVCYLRK